MKKTILLLVLTALTTAYSQEPETFESRYFSIEKPAGGNKAVYCEIAGEYYKMNNNDQFARICSNPEVGGKLVSKKYVEGRENKKGTSRLEKSHRLDAICCVRGDTKKTKTYSYVVVRANQEKLCGEAGKKTSKGKCANQKARVFNRYSIGENEDTKALSIDYSEAKTDEDSLGELDEYLASYQSSFNCKNETTITERKSNILNKAQNLWRKLTGGKSRGEGNLHDKRGHIDKISQNAGVPICCETDNSNYKIVANECACYTATASNAKVVAPGPQKCSTLHKAIEDSGLKIDKTDEYKKEVVQQTEEKLTQSLDDYIQGKKCYAVSSHAPTECSTVEEKSYAYTLHCDNEEGRLIICHKDLQEEGIAVDEKQMIKYGVNESPPNIKPIKKLLDNNCHSRIDQ